MAVAEFHNLTVSKKNGTLQRVPFLSIKETVLGKRYELSISFVSSAVARELNINHRNKDYVPDTLAFPLSQTSGEIILCERAMRNQYKEFGVEYRTYLISILIHSMLHLKGYAHGGTMEDKEKRLVRLFT